MIYLLIKRKSCQEKRREKTNLTVQIHKGVIRLLHFLSPVPTEFGPKVEQWKFICGIMTSNPSFPKDRIIPLQGRPFSPPHPAEAGRSLPEEGQPSRCFFPRSSLPPGHNPSIPEMSNSGSPSADPGVYLKEIIS